MNIIDIKVYKKANDINNIFSKLKKFYLKTLF